MLKSCERFPAARSPYRGKSPANEPQKMPQFSEWYSTCNFPCETSFCSELSGQHLANTLQARLGFVATPIQSPCCVGQSLGPLIDLGQKVLVRNHLTWDLAPNWAKVVLASTNGLAVILYKKNRSLLGQHEPFLDSCEQFLFLFKNKWAPPSARFQLSEYPLVH